MRFTALFAVMLAALPVQAQTAPDWTDELVVEARAPGPVFWRIASDTSEVWVLGRLPALPAGQPWNSARLESLLRGARAVITPPRATAGLFTVIGMLGDLRLPDEGRIEDHISSAALSSLVDTALAIGQTGGRYTRLKPVVAAFLLRGDADKFLQLQPQQPNGRLFDLARKARVKLQDGEDYDAGPLMRELAALPAEESEACMRQSLDDVQFQMAHAVPAADAWARGDLKTLRAHVREPAFNACMKKTASYQAMEARAVDDIVAALTDALRQPGKSVAVFDINALLARQSGAFDRLRAMGYRIDAPTD
ncbi:TraB/GumN family protein [Roseiterribacter gracilis]|uniref:TraB/GumN family protein n=1 Tax=Roseiterribacter gracilis TaxID=2812848 RepID=A0A8S8XHD7_9PROT|nr:TraB/GumN family protein [Rhodospirillales bacterium TMPK1]